MFHGFLDVLGWSLVLILCLWSERGVRFQSGINNRTPQMNPDLSKLLKTSPSVSSSSASLPRGLVTWSPRSLAPCRSYAPWTRPGPGSAGRSASTSATRRASGRAVSTWTKSLVGASCGWDEDKTKQKIRPKWVANSLNHMLNEMLLETQKPFKILWSLWFSKNLRGWFLIGG